MQLRKTFESTKSEYLLDSEPEAKYSILDFQQGRKARDSSNLKYELKIFSHAEIVDDLDLSGPFLENSHFKIVKFEIEGEQRDSENKISELGSLKNETLPISSRYLQTLYHLEKARRYFEALEPENPALQQGQIVIRVDATRVYHSQFQFRAIEAFNRSNVLPPSLPSSVSNWKAEIWFHRPKDVVENSSSLEKLSSVAGAIGSLFVWGPYGIPFAAASLYETFGEDRFLGVDTAMQPAVIAHEYFHLASASPDFFPNVGVTYPLAEDLANYFGSSYTGAPEIYGLLSYVDPRGKITYSGIPRVPRPSVEVYKNESGDSVTRLKPKMAKLKTPSGDEIKIAIHNEYNLSKFVPAFLWTLRQGWPHENLQSPHPFDVLVWQVAKEKGFRSTQLDFLLRLQQASFESSNSRVKAYTRRYFDRHMCSALNLEERFSGVYKRILGITPAASSPQLTPKNLAKLRKEFCIENQGRQ